MDYHPVWASCKVENQSQKPQLIQPWPEWVCQDPIPIPHDLERKPRRLRQQLMQISYRSSTNWRSSTSECWLLIWYWPWFCNLVGPRQRSPRKAGCHRNPERWGEERSRGSIAVNPMLLCSFLVLGMVEAEMPEKLLILWWWSIPITYKITNVRGHSNIIDHLRTWKMDLSVATFSFSRDPM